MKKMSSLLVKSFQPSKCKTQLRLGTSRIKVLRNKKGLQIASDRKEVAALLRNKQDNNARLLVEHVIMEQNLIEAFDLLSLYAERIASQLPIIDSQKTCPPDLKENISTLLYASANCAELPDFALIRPMFVAKYGKDFVSAATELRPGCGVNVEVVEKLSSNGATGETKLRLLKEIAEEHNVDWDPALFEREARVHQDDVLPGPTVSTGVDTSSSLVDNFPSVPNQKPTLGTPVSHPANITNPTSGRFDNVGPTSSPPRRDERTDSPGAVPRFGPPSRNPPERDQARTENFAFDDGTDLDSRSRGAQSRRNQRRESDSFIAPSPLARHDGEDSRRNSIGVPREKSVRAHTGVGRGDVGEYLVRDYKKHNLRDAGPEDIDEAGDKKGSHGTDGRLSQNFTGKEVFGKGMSQNGDQYAEEDNSGRVSIRDGSSKGRSQHGDQYAEEDNSERVSIRDGLRKGRPQHEDQYPEDDKFGRVSIRDGSSKGRLQHEDQYPEDDRFGRVSIRDGSSRGRSQHEDQYPEDDKFGRVSIRDGSSRGRSQHEDQYPEDDKFGRVSIRDGSSKGRPRQGDQYPEDDKFGRVSNRDGSRKGRPQHEDQYPEEGKFGKASSREGSGDKTHYLETSVEEGSRGRISGRGKEDKLGAGKKLGHDYSDKETGHLPHQGEEPRRRESPRKTSKHLDEDPEWDDEHVRNSVSARAPRIPEDEYRDYGRGRDSFNRRTSVEDISRKSSTPSVPQKEVAKYPNERATPEPPRYDSSGDEYDSPRGGVRKPEPRPKMTDFRNFDRSEVGEEGSGKGKRKTSRLSIVDEDSRNPHDDHGSSRGRRHGSEDTFDDEFTSSSRTSTEKRMSLPGGAGRDKSKYQGNRPHDDHDDSARRRATIGPEEIRSGRARETADSSRSRLGEREKQVENRRQSAPLSKEVGTEGRQSQRDKSDRQRKADIPAEYDDDRLARLNPKVSLREDEEYSQGSRSFKDRSGRQRKTEIPLQIDDGPPPPRFLNVGNRSKSKSPSAKRSSKASTQRPQMPSPAETEFPKQGVQAPSNTSFKKPPDLGDLGLLVKMFGKSS